jgi:peptidoglycan endopeptidase LytE
VDRLPRLTGFTVSLGIAVAAVSTCLVGPVAAVAAVAGQRTYVVQAGDTLTAIAARLHTSVATLEALNHLGPNSVIQVGQRLIVPAPATAGSAAAGRAKRYTVQSGDTLSGIASRFGVSLTALLDANHLTATSLIQVGQVLRIPTASAATGSGRPTGHRATRTGGSTTRRAATVRRYTVRPGDTLSGIASRFGVPLATLLRRNDLSATSVIQVGQTLVISGPVAAHRATHAAVRHRVQTASDTRAAVHVQTAARRVVQRYTVVAGDTLSGIASRFDVPLVTLELWNHLQPTSVLMVGQVLVVGLRTVRSATRPRPRDTRVLVRRRTGRRGTAELSAVRRLDRHYTVQAGDTLSAIAARFGIPVGRLLSLNDLSLDAVIRPGQVLLVSQVAPPQARAAVAHGAQRVAQRYRVQAGDTLFGIAQRFGISLAALTSANGITEASVIQPGQMLVIPGPRTAGALDRGTLVTTTLGMRIVAEAKRFLGVPYEWGGASPAGFDCSGLVQYVLGQLGIHVDRTASAQWEEGVPVSRADLQPGDLVFFDTEGGVSHVGIYVGNGLFIHAPTTGQVVQYADLNSPYWLSVYLGARREG